MRPNRAERRAAWHYRLRGYRILGANVWAGGNEVDVRGWPALPGAQQVQWTRDFSDHGLLYFEVQAL